MGLVSPDPLANLIEGQIPSNIVPGNLQESHSGDTLKYVAHGESGRQKPAMTTGHDKKGDFSYMRGINPDA
jgi:hypothetical protein